MHEDGGQEESLVTVSYKDKVYHVKIDEHVCTCSFWRTMGLPC